ncbi:hypothetical protein ARMSODRAFT_1002687 [Armillaria solidipes]|uniref:Uncharacterized protein n=1 Tax=Armillaria solidipes TaxID=1076256 RepID=A0A2H3C8I9_9AGAR|nr:hypothetical protein ARMSODRAFT_1002687 [Armillaria solidipes]
MSVQEREGDSNPKAFIVAFDTLQVLGLVLLLALLAPAIFSPNVKRTATWFGMTVSVIIYCVSYSILMFVGGQDGPEPSAGVCLFQACLVHSAPILPTQLLASSSLLFLIGVLEALAMGLENPKDVRRNESHLYCHITTPTIYYGPSTLVFCILGVIISFATIIAEVAMVVIIRKTIGKLRRQSSSPNIELPTHLLVRLFSFSKSINVYSIVVPSKGSALSAWYFLLNTVPIGGVVTFATQKDILCFYLQRRILIPGCSGERCQVGTYYTILDSSCMGEDLADDPIQSLVSPYNIDASHLCITNYETHEPACHSRFI